MNNNQSSFPLNGQIPNVNMPEINGLMQQFTQLMEGDFMRSMSQLSQLQNLIPNMSGMPILPTNILPSNINMGHINAMITRLQSLVNNDLMRNLYNMQSHTSNNPNYESPSNPGPTTSKATIPIQLWENDQQLYVIANIPGLKSSDDIKIQFLSDNKVLLRTKIPTYRPERNSRLLHSEFLKGSMEREIELTQPVSTKSYSASYVGGIYTLTMTKQTDDVDIAIFDE